MKDQVLMSAPYSPPPAPRSTGADGVLISKPYSPPPSVVAPASPGAETAVSSEAPPVVDDLALGAIRQAPAAPSAGEKRDWLRLVPAYAISLVVHFILLVLFLMVTVSGTTKFLLS